MEILITVGIVLVINHFYFPENIGFLTLLYNPYLFVVAFFSSFYGKKSGLIAFAAAGVMISAYILISDIYCTTDIFYNIINSHAGHNFSLIVLLSFACIMVLGQIRDYLGITIRLQKDTITDMDNQIIKLSKELEAVTIVNQEYEDRILGQQNSLISLYSTIISLNTLNLETIYPNILQAVVQFTGTQSCSLWRFNRDENSIELLSNVGWSHEYIQNTPRQFSTENIMGWSARNNTLFSIKMLQKYQNLKALDNGSSIITVPITVDNQVWGVLNIEKIPFVKYNLYTEQLLLMIADLASPIIRNAIRYSSLVHKEIDPVTGFNSISEFHAVLKEEFTNAHQNKLNLSLLLVELINANAIAEQFQTHDALLIFKEISQLVQYLSKGKVLIFQYKETFQCAAILPNMDFDGASMFCLSLIEQNSKKTYYIKGQIVNPEIVIGYSSLRPNHRSEEDLILLSENLLLMQKI